MGVCNCFMFCCTLLYVHSSIAIILMGKRELIALLNLSSWCLVIVVWLFLAVSWGCLQFVIVVFPDHTHLLFFILNQNTPFFITPFSLEARPRGYKKLFSCSTQLSMKFQLLIKNKIPTNKEVSCFKSLRCCINHANKC